MSRQHGFSLPETLVALLLLTLSISTLMRYQLVLAQGFVRQTEQREAWRQAASGFEGYQAHGWQTELTEQAGPGGCRVRVSTATGPTGRRAQLMLLQCSRSGVY